MRICFSSFFSFLILTLFMDDSASDITEDVKKHWLTLTLTILPLANHRAQHLEWLPNWLMRGVEWE